MRLDFCVASGGRDELEHQHIVPRKICGRCALIETERSAGVK
jgi:hypothetical protein